MQTKTINSQKDPVSPDLDQVTKEVRFAVVMYGGVSLAIYINGVTQELFHMVRATAPGEAEKPASPAADGSPVTLDATERVYQKLSHLLSDKKLLKECCELFKDGSPAEQSKKLKERLNELIEKGAPLHTRFIVDVMSGTSAGGINAIYLGKALANNQRIDRLKELWISEGDIKLLLNDKLSVGGLNLVKQDPPQSLLNSRRMYLKLLAALDEMDNDSGGTQASSRFVDELDLYITTTDIEGVPVMLKLSDMVVYERRHRNVFHFKYAKGDKPDEEFNDFRTGLNPFLAFAARCTSSFPFAFEPMRLCDIDEILDVLPRYRDNKACKSDSQEWQRFFKESLDPGSGQANLRFQKRSFGDGGYLDNKPFSYAIDTVTQRYSDVPAERKLIYIEPSPEHPEDEPERDSKPDALSNVKAAIFDLPTYETIREDLQRILERNQLVERVRRITSGTEKDINKYQLRALKELIEHQKEEKEETDSEELRRGMQLEEPAARTASASKEWAQKDLAEMVKQYGYYYIPYSRLRISSVTDDIARLVAHLANFDEDSDLFLAVRCLVRVWRQRKFYDYHPNSDNGKQTPHLPAEKQQKPINEFLWYYDLSYRLRRLNFLRNRVDQLYSLDGQLWEDLEEFSKNEKTLEELLEHLPEEQREQLRLKYPQMPLQSSGEKLFRLRRTASEQLRHELLIIKTELNEIYNALRQTVRQLRSRHKPGQDAKRSDAFPAADATEQNRGGPATPINPLLEKIEKIGITTNDLSMLLLGMSPEEVPEADRLLIAKHSLQEEEDCFKRADEFLQRRDDIAHAFFEAAHTLQDLLADALKQARERCNRMFDPNIDYEEKSKRGQALRDKIARRMLNDAERGKYNAARAAIREYLGYYYYNFDDYDQISFPIFYEANVGEAEVMEVIRISPEDATSLIDERKERRDSYDGKGRQKLAGTALHHFGAFLDPVWRQNDIMWGRLDGAERLITSLLPGKENEDVRSALIEEAHAAILIEEIPDDNRQQLRGLMTDALVRASAGEPITEAVRQVTEKSNDPLIKTRLEKAIKTSLQNEELLKFVKTGYGVNRNLDPELLLKCLSRSTQIIGKVFEDIANKNQLDGKSLAWIARLGQLFWGLVEVAVPHNVRHLLLKRWLEVIYSFEFFVIIAGLILSRPGAQQFGWTAFGITAALNIVVLLLRDKMTGNRGVRQSIGFAFLVLVLFLAVVGALEISGSIFKFTVGSQHLYPLYWLKEELIEPLIPQSGWAAYLPQTLFIVAAIGLILVINLVGQGHFRRLSQKSSMAWRWLVQGPLGSFILWARFRPIKLFVEDVKEKARPYSDGTGNLYSLPFSLSAVPPRPWVELFYKKFDEVQSQELSSLKSDGLTVRHLVTFRKDELWLTVPLESAPALRPYLKEAVRATNEQYKITAIEKAREDYLNQRLISGKSIPEAKPAIPAQDEAALERLSQDESRSIGRRARLSGVLLGILMLLMGAAILSTLYTNYRQLQQHPTVRVPGGLHGPGLALELVRSPEEVSEAVLAQGLLKASAQGEASADVSRQGQEILLRNIQFDYGFIAFYTIVLGGFCVWLARLRLSRKAAYPALAASLFILMGAGFDLLENYRMTDVLKLGSGLPTQAAVDGIYLAASVKWGAIFIALALLAWLFFRRRDVARHSGWLLAIASLLGLIGLVQRPFIEWGFGSMGLCVLLIGLLLLVSPRTLRMR
jgi:patatin-related protein